MYAASRFVLALAFAGALSAAGTPTLAAEPTLSPAAAALAEYLRIDTSNPPGNEGAGADFLAGRLRTAGIESQRLVSPRGRVSLAARLPATRAGGGALLLLHHIDTVPAGEGWRYPAHSGEVHDGALWGRGAIDAKGLGIAHLEAFLALARSPEPRAREVLFLAVADEEAGGGEGAAWLLTAHPELFAGVDLVLGEGGANKAVAGRTLYWGIEIDQKRPLWLEIATTGRAGHASAANPESATHRLVAGLARLVGAPRPWRATPAARRFLDALARVDPQARTAAADLARLAAPVPPPADGSVPSGEGAPRPSSLAGYESLLTDTLQVTTLAGSERINVVAGEARAGIDVRLLPDTDQSRYLAEVGATLGPGFTTRVRLESPAAPPSSTTTPAYAALASALASAPGGGEPSAPAIPTFIPALTDSRFFRARGIAAYGLSPFALDALELRTVHAPDERISLAVFDRGVATMIRVLRALALAPPGPT